VGQVTFVLPHRFAGCSAVGARDSRLRPPGLGISNIDYGNCADSFAVSVSAAQHKLCLSGSIATSSVGSGSVAPCGYLGGMHSNFLVANCTLFFCVLFLRRAERKPNKESLERRRAEEVTTDTTKNREYEAMLQTALAEARAGLAEGGIPIGAALFTREGKLLGKGHNRRVQEGDPSAHGETDAFRRAGRQRSYRDKIMVTTLAPCWYCSGLIRQFGIGTVVVGESVNFQGGIAWLRETGIEVIDLRSQECVDLLAQYVQAQPEVWKEDIGQE